MGISRQEYWSGLPFASPGDHPDPGTELVSLVSLALGGKFFIAEPPGKHIKLTYPHIFINLSPSYTTFAYDFLLSIVFSPEDVFLIFFSQSNNSSNVIASIKFI